METSLFFFFFFMEEMSAYWLVDENVPRRGNKWSLERGVRPAQQRRHWAGPLTALGEKAEGEDTDTGGWALPGGRLWMLPPASVCSEN